jgi:long-chain-acyl-CoA dehydrogenase
MGAGYDSEHSQFRRLVRDFVRDRITPYHEDWELAGCLDRSLFTEAGRLGLLGFPVPEQFGGPGVVDYRYHAIVVEEVNRAGNAAAGIAFSLQNDVVLPYLTDMTNDEQKALAGTFTGTTVLGIAMTEPATGSDLTGIRTSAVSDGEHYVVNGSKTSSPTVRMAICSSWPYAPPKTSTMVFRCSS